MEITQITPINTQKSKIYCDEELAFVLYQGEIRRFKIKEGEELEEEIYYKIKTEIITKRAKKRVLHLLEKVPRSEQQLRIKLKQGYYPLDVIDIAIDYAKGFGYIDDSHYASMYIQSKVNIKSRREIYAALLTKGVDREVATQVLDEIYNEETEVRAIEKYIRKKGYDLENITREDMRKLNSYLLRKGFSYDEIESVIQKGNSHDY